MNNRRRIVVAIGATLSLRQIAFAQAKKSPVIIGWLSSVSRELGERERKTFRSELAALGWSSPQVMFDERFADGYAERLPALAEELAANKPALLVATTIPSARAAAKAAPHIPIVVMGGDAVSAGLVASYARPGGMITGISTVNPEISEKYLELLMHATSKPPRRVGFLLYSGAGGLLQHKENVRRSAARYAIDAHTAEVTRPEEIEPTLKRLAKAGIHALVVMSVAGPLATQRKQVVKFALEQRWPVIGGTGWAEDGALVSYAADISAAYRRGAYFVARILKGTKPGDLPIERAMTFELVLNMKTARALDLVIPHEFHARVDRVIE